MTTTPYAADRTTLLIVDPSNDGMSAGGTVYEVTRETAAAVGFYDNMRTLMPAIRAARLQVIIVPHHRWRAGDYGCRGHVIPCDERKQNMTVSKVEIERLSGTSSKPFAVVVAVRKAAVGRLENDVGNAMLDAVSASLGSTDARREQRTQDN
jgi:hypothetical protein